MYVISSGSHVNLCACFAESITLALSRLLIGNLSIGQSCKNKDVTHFHLVIFIFFLLFPPKILHLSNHEYNSYGKYVLMNTMMVYSESEAEAENQAIDQ